jgi:hypothetical protein
MFIEGLNVFDTGMPRMQAFRCSVSEIHPDIVATWKGWCKNAKSIPTSGLEGSEICLLGRYKRLRCLVSSTKWPVASTQSPSPQAGHARHKYPLAARPQHSSNCPDKLVLEDHVDISSLRPDRLLIMRWIYADEETLLRAEVSATFPSPNQRGCLRAE